MKYRGKIVKKAMIFYLILPLLLLAYNDSDFDGIADEHDLCPNSQMTDIVDMRGCTIEKLVIPQDNLHHFDIIVGANYIDNSTLNNTFSMDYYYKNFALQLQSANYEEGGLADTSLGLYYLLKPNSKLSLRLGATAIFPTYDSKLDNNNMDYKASMTINYKLESISLFGGASYTMINDDDINSTTYHITYQNSRNYYFGFGSYFISKLYSSLFYSSTSSSYKGGDSINSISLHNHYSIDKNWFTSFGYMQGLSENTSDQIYINLGYYF